MFELALSMSGVSVTYAGGNGRKPLYGARDVDLALPKGKILGVVGESGSGKTTVMKAIAGLVGYSGEVRIAGTDPMAQPDAQARRAWLGERVGIVFQNAAGSLVPNMAVIDQVMIPLDIRREGSREERRAKARQLLDLVRIPTSAHGRRPEEVSGGQRQRIAIARSMVLNPLLLIADEPTSALDISVRAQLLTLLDELRRERNMAIVLISHDLPSVEFLADEIVVMYRGAVVERASKRDLALLRSHPYARDLWRASPSLAGRRSDFAGFAPLRDSVLGGCQYAARCDRWSAGCEAVLPPLHLVGTHHARCINPISATESASQVNQ